MIRTNLEGVLIDINRFINIDSDRQQYTGHFGILKDKIFGELRKTQPFGYLFNGWQLAGSYADNVKVKMPDEFDMVFHLSFPENALIDVEEDPNCPGNVYLQFSRVLKKISKEKQHETNLRHLKKWVDSRNYLMLDKLQSYIESCFTTVLLDMNYRIVIDGKMSTLKYKKQGPAHTIFVVGYNSKMKYSVDFVPGILLNKSQSVCTSNASGWEAIPKPHKDNQKDVISFRSSFSSDERNILKNKLNLKNVLRMMKKFRDSHQNMNKMKSYFIKTLFLWKDKQESSSYWKLPLQEIIIDMFKALENSLITEELPFFWDSRLNLYNSDYPPCLLSEMLNCVRSSRRILEQAAQGLTPALQQKVYCIFLTKSERLELQSGSNIISEDHILNEQNPPKEEKTNCIIL